MRSRDQTNLDHWSLGDWSRYYDAPRRQEVLNVISLEFSRTALAGQVTSTAEWNQPMSRGGRRVDGVSTQVT